MREIARKVEAMGKVGQRAAEVIGMKIIVKVLKKSMLRVTALNNLPRAGELFHPVVGSPYIRTVSDKIKV